MKFNAIVNTIPRALHVAGLLMLTGTAAHAAPLNTWQTAGDVTQNTQLGAISLGSSSYLLGTASASAAEDAPLAAGALNLSGQNPLETGELTAILGLPGAILDDEVNGNFAYEGSALFDTENVQAGDTLNFDWRLFGQINTGFTPVPDTAWLILGNEAFKLADVDSLDMVSNNWLDSGTRHISYTFTQTGSMKIGFVVADVDSYGTSSVLAIQNVALTAAVPEPEGVALALTGLLILGRLSRRSHQN